MLGCRQMCSLLISLEYDNGHIFNIVMYFLSVLPVVHLILQTLVTRWQKCGRRQLFHHVLLDLFYVFKLGLWLLLYQAGDAWRTVMVVLCKVVAVGVNDQYLLSRLENSLWLWCIFYVIIWPYYVLLCGSRSKKSGLYFWSMTF